MAVALKKKVWWFKRYGWCPSKFKWFTWAYHAYSIQWWFAIYGLALATVNLPTYQIWILYLLATMTWKAIQNVEMVWFGG